MEIYEFKDGWNSAYYQKNISEIFTFLYNTGDFPIHLCMVQWSLISLFCFCMTCSNIMIHLLWKIDVFFYFHHNGTQVHTTQIFFFLKADEVFWSFLEMSWAAKGIISLNYLSVFHCQNTQMEQKCYKIAEKNRCIWEILNWLINSLANLFEQTGFLKCGLNF